MGVSSSPKNSRGPCRRRRARLESSKRLESRGRGSDAANGPELREFLLQRELLSAADFERRAAGSPAPGA